MFFLVPEIKAQFNASLQTYLLGGALGYRCVSPDCVADYHPLHKSTVDIEQYVVLKHAVPP